MVSPDVHHTRLQRALHMLTQLKWQVATKRERRESGRNDEREEEMLVMQCAAVGHSVRGKGTCGKREAHAILPTFKIIVRMNNVPQGTFLFTIP